MGDRTVYTGPGGGWFGGKDPQGSEGGDGNGDTLRSVNRVEIAHLHEAMARLEGRMGALEPTPVRTTSYAAVFLAAVIVICGTVATIWLGPKLGLRAERLVVAQEQIKRQVGEVRVMVGQLVQCGERVCLKTAIQEDGSVRQTECVWVVKPCESGSVPALAANPATGLDLPRPAAPLPVTFGEQVPTLSVPAAP